MEEDKAVQIIKMWQDEYQKATNFQTLYQQVADLIYPRENQITSQRTPGEDKSLDIRDPTAIFDAQDMTSGLIGTWIPAGRLFFGLRVKDRKIGEIDQVKRWLALATQIAHDEMFESNFMLQLNETVHALVVFGTGCLFSEWDNDHLGLNYKDWDISAYRIKQDARGNVDTVLLKLPLTARQASQMWESPGENCLKDAEDTKTESKLYEFLHIVRPRIARNTMFVDNLNMPYESVFVNMKEKVVVEEGGFDELPYAVARWEKSSCEKYGRGQGTMVLSAVKELQQMHRDFIECGNKWNNPPTETVDANIEGDVNMSPGARNHVLQEGAIKPIQPGALGSFPITKDMLEFQQEIIHKAFFKDIFVQMSQMKGDRRTTIEIEARLKEGLRRLVSPVSRMESELFTPLITRSVLLLIRNGRIPSPPPELRGKEFGVEYMGELAMAMRDYQARAFSQGIQLVGAMAQAGWPDAPDEISVERAVPDVLMATGFKIEHLSTPEEKLAKKQKRAQDEMQMKMAMAAQTASDAYNKTTKKPEAGSPAAELVGA